MARGINVLLTLVDKFSAPINKVTDRTKQAERQFKNTQNSVNNFAKSANNRFLGLVGTVGKLGVALGTLGGVLTLSGFLSASEKWLEMGAAQLEAETKLEAALKNVVSIQAVSADHYKTVRKELSAYSGELQNLGVVGDEVTLAGMQQLAAFQLNGDEIKQLSAGMLDMLVKYKGLNGTQQDAVTIANAMGKAMQGQTRGLMTYGVILTEEEKEVMKYGDAMQKTATLAAAMERGVGGVNKAMANTDLGKATQGMNTYGDMLENLGLKLMPIKGKFWSIIGGLTPVIEGKAMTLLDRFIKKFDELAPVIDKYIPVLIDVIIKMGDVMFTVFELVGNGIGMIVDNSSALIPILGGLTAGFTAFNVAVKGAEVLAKVKAFMGGVTAAGGAMNFVLSLSKLALASLGIGLVITALILLYQHSDKARAIMQTVYEKLKVLGSFVATVFAPLFAKAFAAIETIVVGVFTQIMTVLDMVQTVFVNLIDFVVNIFTGNWSNAWSNVVNIFGAIFDGLVALAKTPLNVIIDMVNGVIARINSISITAPSWLGGGGFKPEIPSVPNFATGTSYFAGGLAEINEDKRGEVVNLPNGSQIVPHDKTVAQGNSTPSVAVHVTVQGNIVGNDDYADYLGNVIVSKVTAAIGNV